MGRNDPDSAHTEVTVRRGTGTEDGVTMPLESSKPARVGYSDEVRRWHEKDVALGFDSDYLPEVSGREWPDAATKSTRCAAGTTPTKLRRAGR